MFYGSKNDICRSCVSEIKFVDKEHLRVSRCLKRGTSVAAGGYRFDSAHQRSFVQTTGRGLRSCDVGQNFCEKQIRKIQKTHEPQNHHRITTEYPQNIHRIFDVFGWFLAISDSGNDHEWSILLRHEAPVLKPTLQVDKNAPRQRRAAAKQPAVSWCSVASLRSTMRWDPQCLVVSQWCLDMFRATPAFKKRIAGKTVVKLALYLYVKKFIEHNCFFL